MELAVAILADQRQRRTLGLTAVVIVRGGEYGDAAIRAVATGRRAKAPGRAAWDRKIDPVVDPIGGNRVGIADAGALAGGDDACVFLQPLGIDDAEELAGADRRRAGQEIMPVAGIVPDLICARFIVQRGEHMAIAIVNDAKIPATVKNVSFNRQKARNLSRKSTIGAAEMAWTTAPIIDLSDKTGAKSRVSRRQRSD